MEQREVRTISPTKVTNLKGSQASQPLSLGRDSKGREKFKEHMTRASESLNIFSPPPTSNSSPLLTFANVLVEL